MGDEAKPTPVDLTAEEKYWREHHHTQPHATEGTTYEHFAPAYRVGAEAAIKYPGKQFHEIEDDLALDYEKHRLARLCRGITCAVPRKPRGPRSAAWCPRATRPAECAAVFDYRGASAPLVLRIFALQLLLDLRITFPPKRGEVVGDLDRAMIRRQHFDPQRHPAVTDR